MISGAYGRASTTYSKGTWQDWIQEGYSRTIHPRAGRRGHRLSAFCLFASYLAKTCIKASQYGSCSGEPAGRQQRWTWQVVVRHHSALSDNTRRFDDGGLGCECFIIDRGQEYLTSSGQSNTSYVHRRTSERTIEWAIKTSHRKQWLLRRLCRLMLIAKKRDNRAQKEGTVAGHRLLDEDQGGPGGISDGPRAEGVSGHCQSIAKRQGTKSSCLSGRLRRRRFVSD